MRISVSGLIEDEYEKKYQPKNNQQNKQKDV